MKKIYALLSVLLVAALCLSLCACGIVADNGQNGVNPPSTQGSDMPTEPAPGATEDPQPTAPPETKPTTPPETKPTTPPETEPSVPGETEPEMTAKDPIDIETIGALLLAFASNSASFAF